jgi:hypothetical protein
MEYSLMVANPKSHFLPLSAVFTAFLILSLFSVLLFTLFSQPLIPLSSADPMQQVVTETPMVNFLLPESAASIGFANTTGGYGGDVYVVTTLEDADPAPSGSLREAVDAEGKRLIVFAVSGWIDLIKPLHISNPEITIDGSTAPNKGVGLRIAVGADANPMVHVSTNDVIVRYIRLRPGSRGHQVDVNSYDNPGFFETDAILLTGNNGSKVRNVWLDHIDASSGSDGNVEIWGADHITVSNSYIFQGLSHSTHSNVWEWSGTQWAVRYSHSMASLVGNGANNISYINNVFAHNGDRVPLFNGVRNIEYINNLIYNTINSTVKILADSSDDPSGEWNVNFVGNRILNNGPDTRQYENALPRYSVWLQSSVLNVYLKNNISYSRPTNDLPETDALYPDSAATLVDTIHDFNIDLADTVVLDTDEQVIALLNASGVNLPAVDSLHEEIKQDIINALAGNPTGRIIDAVNAEDYPVLD